MLISRWVFTNLPLFKFKLRRKQFMKHLFETPLTHFSHCILLQLASTFLNTPLLFNRTNYSEHMACALTLFDCYQYRNTRDVCLAFITCFSFEPCLLNISHIPSYCGTPCQGVSTVRISTHMQSSFLWAQLVKMFQSSVQILKRNLFSGKLGKIVQFVICYSSRSLSS